MAGMGGEKPPIPAISFYSGEFFRSPVSRCGLGAPEVRFQRYQLSPAGTPELSPGRQSWVGNGEMSSSAGTAESVSSRLYGTRRIAGRVPRTNVLG